MVGGVGWRLDVRAHVSASIGSYKSATNGMFNRKESANAYFVTVALAPGPTAVPLLLLTTTLYVSPASASIFVFLGR